MQRVRKVDLRIDLTKVRDTLDKVHPALDANGCFYKVNADGTGGRQSADAVRQ